MPESRIEEFPLSWMWSTVVVSVAALVMSASVGGWTAVLLYVLTATGGAFAGRSTARPGIEAAARGIESRLARHRDIRLILVGVVTAAGLLAVGGTMAEEPSWSEAVLDGLTGMAATVAVLVCGLYDGLTVFAPRHDALMERRRGEGKGRDWQESVVRGLLFAGLGIWSLMADRDLLLAMMAAYWVSVAVAFCVSACWERPGALLGRAKTRLEKGWVGVPVVCMAVAPVVYGFAIEPIANGSLPLGTRVASILEVVGAELTAASVMALAPMGLFAAVGVLAFAAPGVVDGLALGLARRGGTLSLGEFAACGVRGFWKPEDGLGRMDGALGRGLIVAGGLLIALQVPSSLDHAGLAFAIAGVFLVTRRSWAPRMAAHAVYAGLLLISALLLCVHGLEARAEQKAVFGVIPASIWPIVVAAVLLGAGSAGWAAGRWLQEDGRPGRALKLLRKHRVRLVAAILAGAVASGALFAVDWHLAAGRPGEPLAVLFWEHDVLFVAVSMAFSPFFLLVNSFADGAALAAPGSGGRLKTVLGSATNP